MSDSFQSCFNCSFDFSNTTPSCPNCGLIAVNSDNWEKLSNRNMVGEALVKKYENLKQELMDFEAIERNIQLLNSSKDQLMTRMNALNREIRGKFQEIDVYVREKERLSQDNSILGFLQKITGYRKYKTRQYDHSIDTLRQTIEKLRSDKKKMQMEFYNKLEKIEEYQEHDFQKSQKEKEFLQLSDKIAGILTEITETRMMNEINRIKKYTYNLQRTVSNLEKSFYYFEQVLRVFTEIREKLHEIKPIEKEKNALKSEMIVKSERMKLTKKAKESTYFVKIAYRILEEISKQEKLEFIADFDIMVKYLEKIMVDINSKFSDQNKLNTELDLVQAHVLKVKVWLDAIFKKTNNIMTYLKDETSKLEEHLSLDTVSKIEYYLNVKQNPQIS